MSTILADILKRDRAIVVSGLAGMVTLSWAYLFCMDWGMRHMDVGMDMLIMPAMQHWNAWDLVLVFLRIETLNGTPETFIRWCSELTNLENVQISSDGVITAEMPKEDNNVKKAKSLADFLSRKWAEQSKSEHVICRIRLPDGSVVQSQP